MSSIGPGSGLSSGTTAEVPSVLPVATTDQRANAALGANGSQAQAATATQTAISAGMSAMSVATTTSAGNVPVDHDRVTVIKKAIEKGDYPIVPTKISDAMIAASMLWRSPK